MKEIELSFEALAVANMVLTKKLIGAIAMTKALDDETIAGIFESAAEELTRSTLPISKEGARQSLGIFLAGTGIEISSIWPDN